MKVSKFGGTSLATAEQIIKVCDIITSDTERSLVVVSAPGKRFKDDIKVTDLLINCANKFLDAGSAEVELNAIVCRYEEIAKGLGMKDEIVEVIENDLRSRLTKEIQDKEKFMDLLKAAGEDNSAKLIAAYLKSKGHDAKYINPKDAGLLLSDEYGNARVLPESYKNLKELREYGGIAIFPGFFGYSKTGDVVTFPRGGSDITGSILAAAVQADLYENFTDVDSVFVANPNIIQNPKSISVLTYREMRELSYAGFSVLHEETLEPVYRMGVPVCIKNTNNPEGLGTTIVTERNIHETGPVAGIACDNGFCSIYVSKYLMNREVGFGRKLLNILEDESISYEHIPSGIDDVSVIIREKGFSRDIENRILYRIKNELLADDAHVERNIAMVVLVGEGMNKKIGVAARATSALARGNVNIEMVNQGTSEVSVLFGVKEWDSVSAVKALYEEFFE